MFSLRRPRPLRSRRILAGAALAGFLLPLAACSTDPSGPEPTPARSLTMSFGGDVMFENHLRPLATDPQSLAEMEPYLGAADLSVANMETSLPTTGTPIPGKPFTFQAPPSALESVANAGVDTVTLANNHAADFGEAAWRRPSAPGRTPPSRSSASAGMPGMPTPH